MKNRVGNFQKLVMLAIVLIMMAVVVVPNQPAYAGSKGQKIAVVATKMSAVIVEGKNQNGTFVRWSGYTWWNNVITTEGYWWVGDVKVTVKVGADWRTAWQKVCSLNVTRDQQHDYAYVRCLP